MISNKSSTQEMHFIQVNLVRLKLQSFLDIDNFPKFTYATINSQYNVKTLSELPSNVQIGKSPNTELEVQLM